MALVLSSTITELLRKLAGDKDVEEFIADLTAERLDPKCRVEVYLKLHENYLGSTDEFYAKGDKSGWREALGVLLIERLKEFIRVK
ncbi:MAG: hypothetical protein ACP5GY_07755 [Vulcanisaeta sp.]